MIFKKIFKATDSISKKIEIPIVAPTVQIPISPTIIDDLQDQIDDITDNIENEYYVNYVFDKYDYFISTKPFYFYFEIPLGTVEITSARVSFEVKDYRNSSLTDSRYAITGDSEARPKITFYLSEDKGHKFGNAYGQYETDMRAIDISGDLTGEGIKVIKFTTDNDVCISARIFLKLKISKKGLPTPLGRPEIRTLPATSVTFYSATLNGDIIKTGSGNFINRTTGEIISVNICTKRGFKYAITKADTNDESETGLFVKGKYGLSVTGLSEDTDYYFRAYAGNPLKIFGEYVKFTTLEMSNILISCDDDSDTIYIHGGITSTIASSFASPNGAPMGLTCDGTNLISSDSTTFANKIYIHSGITSTVSSSFDSPNNNVRGLAYDGTNLISCDYSTLTIYLHSGITSTVSDSFDSPSLSPFGLTYNGGNLISSDNYTDRIYIHLGITSTIYTSFASPSIRPRGLAYDGASLISCDDNADKIYIHSDITSTISSSFDSPDIYPGGLVYKE